MTDDTTDGLTRPEFETHEHTVEDPEDGTEIHFTFEADADRGEIAWTAKWNGAAPRTGYTDEISTKHGAVMYPREPKINGARTPGSKLPDEMLDALRADLEAAQEHHQAVEAAEEAAAEEERAQLRADLLADEADATVANVRAAFDEFRDGTRDIKPGAIREAVETGERKEIRRADTQCRDSSRECSTDIRSTYVTPDGRIEHGEWTHTY
jgi:hypothetical protein